MNKPTFIHLIEKLDFVNLEKLELEHSSLSSITDGEWYYKYSKYDEITIVDSGDYCHFFGFGDLPNDGRYLNFDEALKPIIAWVAEMEKGRYEAEELFMKHAGKHFNMREIEELERIKAFLDQKITKLKKWEAV